MHHLLWEPALGAERFFELYCETWRRSVLNLRGRKSVWQWLRQVDLRNAMFLLRALGRTQRMMDPAHYLAEYRPRPAPTGPSPRAAGRRRRSLHVYGDAPRASNLTTRSSGAFGFTSVNVISFVSPFGNVIRIAAISSDVRSTHSSRRDSPSRICFRFGHHRDQVGARADRPPRARRS